MRSAKSNWLAQRITAIILIPLTFWFLYFIMEIISYNHNQVLYFFKSSTNGFLFMLMLALMIYHGKLGLQIIIEDYVSNNLLQKRIIYLINFLSLILFFVSLISILTIKYLY